MTAADSASLSSGSGSPRPLPLSGRAPASLCHPCPQSHVARFAGLYAGAVNGKYLSWVLRHRPDALGLRLEPGGWVAVEALLAGLEAEGKPVTVSQLVAIADADRKGRFSFDSSGLRIRANQGHSVEVDLELEEAAPPQTLFHGTVRPFLGSISEQGLVRGSRHHVHLSETEATARDVGSRRGRPVVLRVDAARMYEDGHRFYRSANGVWLVETVPPAYLAELPQRA